jgi:hypothetical protein
VSSRLEQEAHAWVASDHPHTEHLERALYWLLELEPDAREALRIAALLHDIERAYPDPRSPFDSALHWQEVAYVRYHQTRCAQYLAGWLLDHDADPSVARDAVELVLYHEEGGWPEADLLQAADSLSFIETMTPLIRDWIADARTTPESALAKLEHMYERVQVPQARELGRPLIDAALAECRVA